MHNANRHATRRFGCLVRADVGRSRPTLLDGCLRTPYRQAVGEVMAIFTAICAALWWIVYCLGKWES